MSGLRRTTPVIYVPGPERVIVASNGGSASSPLWFRNLLAQPRALIQVGYDKSEVVARVAEGEERERLWERAVATYPPYVEYQCRTPRELPVVVLAPQRAINAQR